MKELNREIGSKNEKIVEKYLKKHKYSIIFMNYINKIGEIDIIAKNKDIYVFVEVKYRSGKEFGLPCEAVTPYKQQKIRKVASLFLAQNNLENVDVRFDVVEVLGDEINHIIDAF